MGEYLWHEVVICFWMAVLSVEGVLKCVSVPGWCLFLVDKLFANCCNNPDSPTQVKFCSAEAVVGRQLNWWFFIHGDLEYLQARWDDKAALQSSCWLFSCAFPFCALPPLPFAGCPRKWEPATFQAELVEVALLSDIHVLCTVWADGTFACRLHFLAVQEKHTVTITLCTCVFPSLLWKNVVRLQP